MRRISRICWLCLIVWAFACECFAQIVFVEHEGIEIMYDCDKRCPLRVEWICDKSYLGNSQREPNWRFMPDKDVPNPRAEHDDYSKSGFDRGHMCPSADRSASSKAMRATFLTTNICPQRPKLNRGEWKKVETACRKMALNNHPVRVIAYAVFENFPGLKIGRHGVSVPSGFYKYVFMNSNDSLIYAAYYANE